MFPSQRGVDFTLFTKSSLANQASCDFSQNQRRASILQPQPVSKSNLPSYGSGNNISIEEFLGTHFNRPSKPDHLGGGKLGKSGGGIQISPWDKSSGQLKAEKDYTKYLFTGLVAPVVNNVNLPRAAIQIQNISEKNTTTTTLMSNTMDYPLYNDDGKPVVRVAYRSSRLDEPPSLSDSQTIMSSSDFEDSRKMTQILEKKSVDEKFKLALQKRREEIETSMNLESKPVKLQANKPESPEKTYRLASLMLDRVLEREKSHREFFHSAGGGKKALEIAHEFYKGPKYIYAVNGRTIVSGKLNEGKFPNSFLRFEDLLDPEKDPKGYKRFSTKVSMNGFDDEDIIMKLTGHKIQIIGIRRTRGKIGGKLVQEEIYLPPDVFPDQLKIARNDSGDLIFQETWNFS